MKKTNYFRLSSWKQSGYKFLYVVLIFTIFLTGRCDRFKDFESGEPKDIIAKAVDSYQKKEPDKFLKLFSQSAIKKMDRSLQSLRMQFKTLDPQYRDSLAEKMNMDPGSLANLKMSDYVLYNMNLGVNGAGSDNILFPVEHVADSEFTGIEQNESTSKVKYKNAVIYMVKENNFWKIDTFEIESNKAEPREHPGE